MTEDRVREFLQQVKPVVLEMKQLSWKLRELGADEDAAMNYERNSCWDASSVVFQVIYRGTGEIWTAVMGSTSWWAGGGASPEEALQNAQSNIMSTRDELLALIDTMVVHDS